MCEGPSHTNPFAQAIIGKGTPDGYAQQASSSREDVAARVCAALDALRPLLALVDEAHARRVLDDGLLKRAIEDRLPGLVLHLLDGFGIDAYACTIMHGGIACTALDYAIACEGKSSEHLDDDGGRRSAITRLLWARTDGGTCRTGAGSRPSASRRRRALLLLLLQEALAQQLVGLLPRVLLALRRCRYTWPVRAKRSGNGGGRRGRSTGSERGGSCDDGDGSGSDCEEGQWTGPWDWRKVHIRASVPQQIRSLLRLAGFSWAPDVPFIRPGVPDGKSRSARATYTVGEHFFIDDDTLMAWLCEGDRWQSGMWREEVTLPDGDDNETLSTGATAAPPASASTAEPPAALKVRGGAAKKKAAAAAGRGGAAAAAAAAIGGKRKHRRASSPAAVTVAATARKRKPKSPVQSVDAGSSAGSMAAAGAAAAAAEGPPERFGTLWQTLKPHGWFSVYATASTLGSSVYYCRPGLPNRQKGRRSAFDAHFLNDDRRSAHACHGHSSHASFVFTCATGAARARDTFTGSSGTGGSATSDSEHNARAAVSRGGHISCDVKRCAPSQFVLEQWLAAALHVSSASRVVTNVAEVLRCEAISTRKMAALLTANNIKILIKADNNRLLWGISARLVAEAAERLRTGAAEPLPPATVPAAMAAPASTVDETALPCMLSNLAQTLNPEMTEA
ncbi:hypothetical protein JKP88DRAFT_251575 [Tribonema minus]|uniref:Uncharacterized protein n=1 Tax=Tribonema minus TaxID=303371 RepID=A0A835ZFX0_9STRA|nr:hypothetical protein JKP88DRAFT_251575 [Tribonema minus]